VALQSHGWPVTIIQIAPKRVLPPGRAQPGLALGQLRCRDLNHTVTIDIHWT